MPNNKSMDTENSAINLVIYPTLIKALNTDISAFFEIRATVVKDRRGSVSLDQYRNSALTAYDRLRIFIIKDQKKYLEVLLPSSVESRLLEYFRQGPPSNPFDCNGFVHFIYEVPFKFCSFDFNRWRLLPFSGEHSVKPGQAILIGDSVPGTAKNGMSAFKSSNHLAIYLSDTLFLSKFGTTEGLIVADLASMQRGFGGDAVWALEKIG